MNNIFWRVYLGFLNRFFEKEIVSGQIQLLDKTNLVTNMSSLGKLLIDKLTQTDSTLKTDFEAMVQDPIKFQSQINDFLNELTQAASMSNGMSGVHITGIFGPQYNSKIKDKDCQCPSLINGHHSGCPLA